MFNFRKSPLTAKEALELVKKNKARVDKNIAKIVAKHMREIDEHIENAAKWELISVKHRLEFDDVQWIYDNNSNMVIIDALISRLTARGYRVRDCGGHVLWISWEEAHA